MQSRSASVRAVVLAVLLFAVGVAAAASNDDIGVTVHTRDGLVIIDVDLPLDVTPEEAWPTISDYDRMSEFIPNLTESRILSRDGNRLRVQQKGTTSRGPFTFSFENVRDVVLVPPTEIRTELVSGSLRSARSITRVVRTETGSRLHNHGEYLPAPWIPASVATSMIADETREQFGRIRAEIMRRKGRIASSTP